MNDGKNFLHAIVRQFKQMNDGKNFLHAIVRKFNLFICVLTFAFFNVIINYKLKQKELISMVVKLVEVGNNFQVQKSNGEWLSTFNGNQDIVPFQWNKAYHTPERVAEIVEDFWGWEVEI